jgi:hypothetical protein
LKSRKISFILTAEELRLPGENYQAPPVANTSLPYAVSVVVLVAVSVTNHAGHSSIDNDS